MWNQASRLPLKPRTQPGRERPEGEWGQDAAREGWEVAVPARISGGAGAWDDQAVRAMKSRVQGEGGQVCGGHSNSVCREVSCLKPGPQERGNESLEPEEAPQSATHTH